VLGNPITTASDTYSLGVLLVSSADRKPALRVQGADHGRDAARGLRGASAQARPCRFENGKRLDADLEAILLKALRKEPQERYLTAERLADDLRAYLEGQAGGGAARHVALSACKFIRRHRWAWQQRRAGRHADRGHRGSRCRQVAGQSGQRRAAQGRGALADLRQLSNSLLSELDEAIKQLPGSTGVQKLLVTRVLEHLDRMAKDAQGDRQTQLDLAWRTQSMSIWSRRIRPWAHLQVTGVEVSWRLKRSCPRRYPS
jgi:hypothetical protein